MGKIHAPPPIPFLDAKKQRNVGIVKGGGGVIGAPCRTTKSIQESTIGPIDRNLATPSLQFPGFGVFQGISPLSPPVPFTKRRLLGKHNGGGGGGETTFKKAWHIYFMWKPQPCASAYFNEMFFYEFFFSPTSVPISAPSLKQRPGALITAAPTRLSLPAE